MVKKSACPVKLNGCIKKSTLVLWAAAAFFLIAPGTVLGAQSQVYVMGELLETDVAPVNIDGYVYVQARTILEALGFRLEWDGSRQMAIAEGAGPQGETFTFSLKIDSTDVVFNASQDGYSIDDLILPAPPKIIEGRTMLPVRAVSYLTLKEVAWDSETGIVTVDNYKRNDGEHYIYVTGAKEGAFQIVYLGYLGESPEGKAIYRPNPQEGDPDFLELSDSVTYQYGAEEPSGGQAPEPVILKELSPEQAIRLFNAISDAKSLEYLVVTIEDGKIVLIKDDRAAAGIEMHTM